MFYAFLTIIAGMMISFQSSCNGLLFPFLGVLGVGFVSLLLNSAGNFVLQLATTRRLPDFKKTPVQVIFAGIFAVFSLGLTGFCVDKLGTAVTVCLSVSGQLFMSAIVDHFGFFGTEKIPIRATKIPVFLCILAGILIINFAGAPSFSSVPNKLILFFCLLLALLAGFITIIARMFTYETTKYMGKFGGGCMSCLTGAVIAILLMFVLSGFHLSFDVYWKVPPIGYLTGPLGTISCFFSNIAYDRIKIFFATICLLVGQIAAGILADLILLGSFQPGKIIGITVVCIGIFLDKKISASK